MKNSFDILPAVQPGQKVKVLLVGNGINLPFEGSRSTDNIIMEAWRKYHQVNLPRRNDFTHPHPVWKLPFPMEVVAATKDNVEDELQNLAKGMREIKVCDTQTKLVKKILDANFDAILTTNYSLEIEKSVLGDCSYQKIYSHYRTTMKQSERQKRYGIFQCIELPCNNYPLLWHIHGTSLRKDSLIMGQLSYGKLLSEVEKRATIANRGYYHSITNNNPFYPKSWIDYFLIADVYIIGFQMDFSESDIWWLLSYKRNVNPESKVFFFQPYINDDMKLMIESYGVETPGVLFEDTNNINEDFINYYNNIFQNYINQGGQ